VRMAKETGRTTTTHLLESADGGASQNAKEKERAMGTHELESAEGETSENGKRYRARDGHSPTGERTRRNESE
jgi:hypothetical protein